MTKYNFIKQEDRTKFTLLSVLSRIATEKQMHSYEVFERTIQSHLAILIFSGRKHKMNTN